MDQKAILIATASAKMKQFWVPNQKQEKNHLAP